MKIVITEKKDVVIEEHEIQPGIYKSGERKFLIIKHDIAIVLTKYLNGEWSIFTNTPADMAWRNDFQNLISMSAEEFSAPFNEFNKWLQKEISEYYYP